MGQKSLKRWLVVRDLEKASHTLVEGDIIKLGNFKFRVRQLATSSCAGVQPELGLDDQEPICCTSPEEASKQVCRICLLEGGCDGDPLISPCRCKGTNGHVHLGCLRRWINDRLNRSDDAPDSSYFYQQLACEICK